MVTDDAIQECGHDADEAFQLVLVMGAHMFYDTDIPRHAQE